MPPCLLYGRCRGISESETGILKPINVAVDGAHNSVRLSSTSLVERIVFNGRITARQRLTGASASDQRAEESLADGRRTVWRTAKIGRVGEVAPVCAEN